ncbi:hypothetical protein ACFWY9_24150 [Amycolatopsis sp. NPDC059027]|uniref:hypothetical protein n=1 Tax=unclassified Amycolatopsis TaxID=2618356 RepID=UPI003670E95B
MSEASEGNSAAPALVTASAVIPAALLFVLSAVVDLSGWPLVVAAVVLVAAALGLIALGQSMRQRRARR